MYKKKLNSILNHIIDGIYPPRCPVCGEVITAVGRSICKACITKLSIVREPTCLKCGKQLSSDIDEYCYDCQNNERTFEYAVALLNYDSISQNMMAKLKYKNKREYAAPLAHMLAIKHKDMISKMNASCIMPVPIHASRRRIRGYNQAELLARELSRHIHIPVVTDVLIRIKKTIPLKKLTPDQRFTNLVSAFDINPKYSKVPYENILIVDDIYTTGATMEAITRVLKSYGASKVYGAYICIGQSD